MKQLIVALIGETGSGKSTFASMCTDENIHPIIAGVGGKKGTTKSVKKMTYIKDFEFNIDQFKKNYEQDGNEITIPLSTNIELSPFDTMTILDTQGLNDWKTEDEKEEVYNKLLEACGEADIIFVTIPEGGSVVTTNTILQKIFEQFCHKPIVFIYKAQQSRIKYLKKEKCIEQFTKDVNENLKRYKEIHPKLSELIKTVELPEDVGISPLFSILPNSEELSSDIDVKDRLCNNSDLKKCINSILQYAINLQKLLLDEMRNEYVKNNTKDIEGIVKKLLSIKHIAKGVKSLTGYPLCRPYVKNHNFSSAYNIEYSWQGGTPWMYPVCGGDYTYAASDIYINVKNMIRRLLAPVSIKSSLYSVLESICEDRWTPGSLNLPIASPMRGIPVEWLIDIRTELYRKHPDIFRDVNRDDFDNKVHYSFLYKTDIQFKNNHQDWDKYLESFYYYRPEQQNIIEQTFKENEWQAMVMIYVIIEVIPKIDFYKNIDKKLTEDFWNDNFNEDGQCVLWNTQKK